MQRYFLNENYTQKETYEMNDDNYHHIVRVMRMVPGDRVFLVFHQAVTILAEITDIQEEIVVLKEIEKERMEKELPVQVTLACGYPKGDKFEWIIQKGTELGSQAFIGFPAASSVVKWDHKKREKKELRFQKIAKEAAEQSHRQVIPEIHLLEQEQQLIALFKEYDHVLIAYEESAKNGEKSQLATTLTSLEESSSLLVVFGPEGGFSKAEVTSFQKAGGKVCGLGPRILRTETAPMYVLSAISYQMELL